MSEQKSLLEARSCPSCGKPCCGEGECCYGLGCETKDLPFGWGLTHLEAYREGYADALRWALTHDEDEIREVLDRD